MKRLRRTLSDRILLAYAVLRSDPVSYTMTGGSQEQPSLVVTFVRADIARVQRAIR